MVHQPEKFDHFGIVTHTKTQFIVTSWSRRYNLSKSVYRSLQLEHSENIQGPKKTHALVPDGLARVPKKLGSRLRRVLQNSALAYRRPVVSENRHPAASKESKVTMEDSRLCPCGTELLVIKMGTLKNISMS